MLFASGAAGVNVAVVPVASSATVAAIATPPAVGASVNVDVVIVAGSIARENVAAGLTPIATPVAALAGAVDVTVGAEFTVVKLQV